MMMAVTNGNAEPKSVDFCTLAMVMLEDVYPPPTSPDQSPKHNIIGGAGAYAALGARLFSPPPLSTSIAWIIDEGPDFPPEIKASLAAWKTNLIFRHRADATTHARISHDANQHQTHTYLTAKKQLTPDDLPPEILTKTRSFHLLCSPERCIEIVSRIRERLAEASAAALPTSQSQTSSKGEQPSPLIIYEPLPTSCNPSSLPSLIRALPYIDVLSPNHTELASILSSPQPSSSPPNKEQIETQSRTLQTHLTPPSNPPWTGTILIRAGAVGCHILSPQTRTWLPAYHADASSVVDPTGAGNAFLGGFAVGMVRTRGDVVEAARWGSVAAGFAVEQVGVPELHTVVESRTCVDEVWNGEGVGDRLEEFRGRTG